MKTVAFSLILSVAVVSAAISFAGKEELSEEKLDHATATGYSNTKELDGIDITDIMVAKVANLNINQNPQNQAGFLNLKQVPLIPLGPAQEQGCPIRAVLGCGPGPIPLSR